MKTSNKLLIILATALLVIPLSAMVYYSKSTRVDRSVYEAAMKVEGESATTTDKLLDSKDVQAFKNVHIDGNNILYTNISIIKSDKPLLKFKKNKKNIFTTTVDSSGTLHIKLDKSDGHSYTSIFIFAPAIESIKFDSVQVAKFETNFEQMHIIANTINNGFNFGENKNLKTLSLTVNDNRVNFGKSYQVNSFLIGLEQLNLNINNGSATLAPNNYKNIQANLDNARFNFMVEREADKTNQVKVGNLNINSKGPTTISLPQKSIEIGELSGSLSDSTTIDLPYYRVKSLFSK